MAQGPTASTKRAAGRKTARRHSIDLVQDVKVPDTKVFQVK